MAPKVFLIRAGKSVALEGGRRWLWNQMVNEQLDPAIRNACVLKYLDLISCYYLNDTRGSMILEIIDRMKQGIDLVNTIKVFQKQLEQYYM